MTRYREVTLKTVLGLARMAFRVNINSRIDANDFR